MLNEMKFSQTELILLREVITKELIYYNGLLKDGQRVAFTVRSEIAFTKIASKIDWLIDRSSMESA